MNNWVELLSFSTFGAALLLSAIGLWFTVVIPGIDHWSRRFFMSYFIVFLLGCLSNIIEVIFQYYNVPRAVFIFLLLLESLLLSLPLLMLTAYLLHCCGENIRTSKLFHAVLVLWAVFAALLVSTLFIDDFMYITPDDQYFRGSLYWLPLVPIIVAMLLNFIGTMRRRTQLSRKVFLAFIIAILPITVTLIVHLFIDVFPLIDVSYVLSALAMYSFILSDQIEQDRRQQQKIVKQQQEIAHERASVMVLQMRPHFIYNTLAQYDDMLIVDYDTPFTNFRLPPLTLQPIVENAVKHSMNPNFEPLHISVRTQRTDSGTEIIVEDTGPGFDLSDTTKPHITLKNIE